MNLKLYPNKSRVLFTLCCFAILVFPIPSFAGTSTGNLVGFVYGKDGKSPMQDAIVLLRGLDTEKVYQSEPTGKSGNYRISGIDTGIYIAGLKINDETYNVDDYVNVAAGETDTLSLSLGGSPDPGGASPQKKGWCCHGGKIFKSTMEECNNRGGEFFSTKKEAKKRCGIPPAGFFKSPAGIAVLVVGTTAAGFGIYKLVEQKKEEEVSPTKK